MRPSVRKRSKMGTRGELISEIRALAIDHDYQETRVPIELFLRAKRKMHMLAGQALEQFVRSVKVALFFLRFYSKGQRGL